MSTRREMGSLEREVLMCLWASEDPMSPADVRLALGDGLAYTTVMTVLSRLWRKGMAERLAMGRGFVYRPVLSEAELAAERMHKDLRRSTDQEGALAKFVSGLSKGEANTLRRLIGPGRPPR